VKNNLFPDLPRPIIFGHRGYSAVAPENTMSAFQACVDHDIRAIELDIHLCATGELVVTHDHSLKRVSGTEGIVEYMDYDALQHIDVGSWFSPEFTKERIPLLKEVFDAFGSSCFFDIELKSREKKDFGLALAAAALIREYRLEKRVLISSFNPLQLNYFKKHSGGKIPTAIIFSEDPEVPKFLRRGFGRFMTRCTVVKPEYLQLTEQRARKLQKRYFVFTWTVDEPELIREMASYQADGIISNDPVLVRKIITSL